MSTYQCSVYFYICDLNLEVIEKFQANKDYRLPHWKKDWTICPWKFPEIRPGLFGQMVSVHGLGRAYRKAVFLAIKIIGKQIGKVIYAVSTKTES